MESIALGIESQVHALATRKAQIAYSQALLLDARKKYELAASSLNHFLGIYRTNLADYMYNLQKLRDEGRRPKDPDIQETRARIRKAARYVKGLKRRLKDAKNTHDEDREKNLAAIELWKSEVVQLENWLARPEVEDERFGWVWETDEPSDDEGDGLFRYCKPMEVWDEYNVRSHEDFI